MVSAGAWNSLHRQAMACSSCQTGPHVLKLIELDCWQDWTAPKPLRFWRADWWACTKEMMGTCSFTLYRDSKVDMFHPFNRLSKYYLLIKGAWPGTWMSPDMGADACHVVFVVLCLFLLSLFTLSSNFGMHINGGEGYDTRVWAVLDTRCMRALGQCALPGIHITVACHENTHTDSLTPQYNVITWNVSGSVTPFKWCQIYAYLKHCHAYFAMLEEMRWTLTELQKVHTHWRAQVCSTYLLAFAWGELIWIISGVPYVVDNFGAGSGGRYVITEEQLDLAQLTLVGECASSSVHFFTLIFNASVKTATYQNIWKYALFLPLAKKKLALRHLL